jgi:hypothetical protein
VLVALINKDKAEPDLEELGQMVGMTLKEIKQTLDPNADPNADPGTAPKTGAGRGQKGNAPNALIYDVGKEMSQRVRGQIENAFKTHQFGDKTRVNMGFKHRFERSLQADGVEDAIAKTNRVFSRMDSWLADVVPLGEKEFSGVESFMALFDKVLDYEIGQAVGSDS